jgi:hypothetical protein
VISLKQKNRRQKNKNSGIREATLRFSAGETLREVSGLTRLVGPFFREMRRPIFNSPGIFEKLVGDTGFLQE